MLDILFVVLCVVLLTVIVMSTSYDFYLKRQNLPHMCNREHYKRPISRGRKYMIHSLVSVFSRYIVRQREIGLSRTDLICSNQFDAILVFFEVSIDERTSTSSLVINLIVAFWVICTCSYLIRNFNIAYTHAQRTPLRLTNVSFSAWSCGQAIVISSNCPKSSSHVCVILSLSFSCPFFHSQCRMPTYRMVRRSRSLSEIAALFRIFVYIFTGIVWRVTTIGVKLIKLLLRSTIKCTSIAHVIDLMFSFESSC